MAEDRNPKRRSGVISAEEARRRKIAELEATGDYVWMIQKYDGAPALVRKDRVAKKLTQGFVEAEMVEEVVRRPIVKAVEKKTDEPKPATKKTSTKAAAADEKE